ncbi:MAG: acetate/propionate family kinase [Victivallaceae bacterium]
MNVLVFNCGSSSLKYKIISMPGEQELAGGAAERVGPKTSEPSRIVHRYNGKAEIHQVEMRNHHESFLEIMKLLSKYPDLIPDAVGHRVVHGGKYFTGPVISDDSVLKKLEEIKDLAPLHNPPIMELMYACGKSYPALPQVPVFDTAFHSTIPDYAAAYPIPADICKKMNIRKYGFHGTSHQYVVEEAAKFLGISKDRINAVSCHLGSGGASLCAVSNGKSIDNTMGYSPLQGLVMSTRCGDLDPAISMQLLSLHENNNEEVDKILNRQSGVLGLSGYSSDIRDVFNSIASGGSHDERLLKTAEVYLWRIKKYLGAYLAVTGRVDAVIFTDTIGEEVPFVRANVCLDMEAFGLIIDHAGNNNVHKLPSDIAAANSPVKILVIATNEELAIARRTYETITGHQTAQVTQESRL